MYRLELKKRNKKTDKSAKGSYKYITRSELSNKDMVKSTDIEYTFSKVPKLFEDKVSNFWNSVDKNERKNGRVNSELLISIPREFDKKERIKLVDNLIKEILDKNTPYSYAIHNPIASDGLHNPHCHLMIYEKNFNRSFFKEDFTKEIDKNYFKGTFKKDENYIKKNLNYEKKSFIYDSREKFEEQLLIMSKSKTKEEIISSSEKSKEKDDYDKTKENKISSKDYEQLIKTEQVLMENVRGEYMENFKKVLKDDDSLNSLKNMLEKLNEKDLEKFVVMFSKESKFFEDVKNLSIDELKAKNYTNETVKNILTEIVDINTLQSDETLINKDSDLLKIDKSIREQTNARDITDKYIFDQVVSELFKGDNESSEESENETNVNLFKLNVPRYNELNYFLENLKNDFPFKIADYITETKVNISGDENENSTLEVKCKQLNKEKHEIDCISYEKKFNKKEEDFFSNDILRNQLRLFYYEFLNYFDENIVGKDETPGYTEFYENLENNLSNEYMELTKSFVYTNLFYNIDTNYFATKDDENENKKNNSKSIDFDFLNPYSNKENLHNKVFMPNLSKQINENVLNMLDNEETEYTNIGDKSVYKVSERKDYVNKIKSILENNVKYLNQDTEFFKSNIFSQALKDRDVILKNGVSKKENGEETEYRINFKVKTKINGKEEEKTYKQYVDEVIKTDKKKLNKNLSGTFLETGTILDTVNYSDIGIKENLRPNLPLLKVKKFLIDDLDFGSMKEIRLDKKESLIELGSEKESYYKYKLKENVFKSPSVLEHSYNHALSIQNKVDINKDINHLIYLSLDKTKEDRLVLSNVKLEKAKRYNLVDLKEIENFIGKVDKSNVLKISKNISDKIYDKNFIHKKLAKEFDTKKKINDKVREKSALTYIGYSDDIEKINHTLKEIEYNSKRKFEEKISTDMNEMLKLNSIGLKENENNLETIEKFFNWNTVKGYKISEKIKDTDTGNFGSIIVDKTLKTENDNIKKNVLKVSQRKEKISIPDEMEKVDTDKMELFLYKKKEVLAFQLEIATKNISIANVNSDDEDVQTLSEVEKISKKSLAYMKKVMDSRSADYSKTPDILELEKAVKKFEETNEKKIEKRKEIENRYFEKTSLDNLTEYVKEKKMLVVNLEWEQTQITDDKIKEKPYAITFKGKDLYKYNKDLILSYSEMEDENLYFKIYLKEENSDNKRIIDLTSYNNSINADNEKIDKIVEDKIIFKYFYDKGYSKAKKEEEWQSDEREDLKQRLDKNSKYWNITKESVINDTSLLEITKRLVANGNNFQNAFLGMEKKINFETSLEKISSTKLGGIFVEQIKDYLVQETEFKKEIYRFKNKSIQEHLEVEGLVDEELKLKRKVKEISFFKERKKILTEAYNLDFNFKNGEINFANESEKGKKKVNKKISFEQNTTKINLEIEKNNIVPLDVKKKTKKKNMSIVKNNSEYLNTLKEIEMSI